MQKTLLFLIGGLLLSLQLQAQFPASPILEQSGCDGSIVFNVEGDACGACELRLFKDKIPANDPEDEDQALPVIDGSEATFGGLCTGLYRFALYNADFDCYYFYDFEVQMELCQLSLTGISKKDEICGDDGSVLATIDADNYPPFQYQLLNAAGNVIQTASSNDFSYTFEGLSEGTYSVKVTNDGACVVSSSSVQIADLDGAISIDNVTTNTDECGTGNGSITLEVSGGSGQYSYNWSPNGGFSIGGSSFTIGGLTAGTYNIDVSDSQSFDPGDGSFPVVCSASTTATVVEEDTGNCNPPPPPPCQGFSVSINKVCSSKFARTLTASASGTNDPVSYSWTYTDVSTGTTTPLGNGESITLDASGSGIFPDDDDQVCVTASTSNCTASSCISGLNIRICPNSSIPLNVDNLIAKEKLLIGIQPNPFQNQVELNIDNPTDQNMEIRVLDSKGTLVQTQQLFLAKGVHRSVLDLSNLSSGAYQLLFIGTQTEMQVERVLKMK
ncbi:MAG: T9SS type A sorting domain-containing protein [Bacteroidota bacterium]